MSKVALEDPYNGRRLNGVIRVESRRSALARRIRHWMTRLKGLGRTKTGAVQ